MCFVETNELITELIKAVLCHSNTSLPSLSHALIGDPEVTLPVPPLMASWF